MGRVTPPLLQKHTILSNCKSKTFFLLQKKNNRPFKLQKQNILSNAKEIHSSFLTAKAKIILSNCKSKTSSETAKASSSKSQVIFSFCRPIQPVHELIKILFKN